MTTLKTIETKGKLTSVMFENAIMMYAKISEKAKGAVYEQYKLPRDQQTRWEYTVDVIVDEDVADEWDELFPKQSAKKLLKKAFKEKYRIEKDEDFPEGINPSDKKFYVITVKQGSHYPERELDEKTKKKEPTGKWLPFSSEIRPKAVLLEDGKKKDITLTGEIGNGSVGTVYVKVNHSNNPLYGASAKLRGVLVTDLVVWSGGGGGNNDRDEAFDDLFGDVEFEELPEGVAVEGTAGSTTDSSDELDEEDDVPPFDTLDEDDF